MRARRAAIGWLGALAACVGTPTTPVSTGSDSGTPGWVTDLGTTLGAPAAYAIVDDEQGPYLAIMAIAGSSASEACPTALGSASTQIPRGQWTLEIASPLPAGQYGVLSAQNDPIYPNIGDGGSIVRLVYFEPPATAFEMYPVSGSVSIESGPSNVSDELGGQHLNGSFHLGFAAEPLQGDCSYATATYDLGVQVITTHYVCACDTPEGKLVSTCDGGGGNFDGCCYEDAPAAFTVDGTFDAAPCPGLCVAPLGLSKACHPLNPDAG